MFLGTKSYLWLLKSAKKSARFSGIFSQILTGFLSLDNQADVGKYLFHSKYIMKVGFINIIQNHGERNSFIFFSYLLPYGLRYSKETGARVYIDTHKLHNCYIQLKNGDDGYGDELFLRDGWHTNSWKPYFQKGPVIREPHQRDFSNFRVRNWFRCHRKYTFSWKITPQYLFTGKYQLPSHNFPRNKYSWESFFPGKYSFGK